uniref:Uncharacterized protein n=1 Tax=Timema tahoe TaxID=61484 RepID=A0A7R9FIM8_9NEOP|nr:unnamed protein product [Timema tahoe]
MRAGSAHLTYDLPRLLVHNTYTNAEKLLTAAEELAQTGECNADEIYSVAHELESHVTSFAARVEQRRRRLDLTVLFYNREKEDRGLVGRSTNTTFPPARPSFRPSSLQAFPPSAHTDMNEPDGADLS